LPRKINVAFDLPFGVCCFVEIIGSGNLMKTTITDDSLGKFLRLTIPLNLTLGPRIELGTPLIFEVALHGQNIQGCELVVESDANTFAEASQHISVEGIPQNLDRNVKVSLNPIAVTEKPVYVSIKAQSDSMSQEAGFFVQVVATQQKV
jgi:hypothetical protein